MYIASFFILQDLLYEFCRLFFSSVFKVFTRSAELIK